MGCARKAYNVCLAESKKWYDEGRKWNRVAMNNWFNSIKDEYFPYMREVTKFAPQYAIMNLDAAFKNFFSGCNKRNNKGRKIKFGFPKFKRKNQNRGSFTIGGNGVHFSEDKSHIWVARLGYVKMTHSLKYDYNKICYVTFSVDAGRFYASILMGVTLDEFLSKHKPVVDTTASIGIDLGLKSLMTLSSDLEIVNPKFLAKAIKRLKKEQRNLMRKQHPKTKGDVTPVSNNFRKQSLKVAKCHKKVVNKRMDYYHKFTSVLIRNFKYICVEDLNVVGMMKNHKLASSIQDASFSTILSMLEYKSKLYGRKLVKVSTFYPSSKTCSNCGSIKNDLKLSDRIYHCENCGISIDRDYNASLNIEAEALHLVGTARAELTPVDLTALLFDLGLNQIITSKVETGIQQKS